MPLRVGLVYTQMKLGRAYEHLSSLKSEIDRFTKSKPYSITRYDYPPKQWHILCIKQAITPDKVGVLIGEFAHAIRSGLDNLAWQLALLTTDKPGRLTAFPIESECPLPGNKSFKEKIANIPPDALKVIESLQPYTNQPQLKLHPLWRINKLANLDKHQVVPICSINFWISVNDVSMTHGRRDDEVNHTIEIAIPLAEKDKVKFEVECSGIEFGEPIDTSDALSSFSVTWDGLREIYEFVRNDAVPRFEQFFR
jgi:hypothetical protein